MMKKILAYILAISLVLAPFPATAFLNPDPQKVVYRGTVTGLRISAVDGGATESGGAFIDGANASITALADGAHQIEIYDSANRMLKGVLKAAGSAEGLGSEILANNDFGSAEPPGTAWTRQTGWTIAGGLLVATTAANDSAAFQTFASKEGQLLKHSFTVDSVVSGAFYANITGVSYPPNPYANAPGTYSKYITGIAGALEAYCLIMAADTTTGTISTSTYKQVLAPSTSGCTVVSQKAGTLFNFSYKHPSFLHNEVSYLVVVRLLR